MSSYLFGSFSVTRKRDKIWIEIISTKQWISKLFTSEAYALIHKFVNNPPPEIETQSYSGNNHNT